ncbi:hypothetical protein EYF80_054819 [Liparis tanakae]|uniref:Uncharacterized protein n=1 Tax=Liparis tanakae TaxID=230148 RepID=A0A4Z2F1L1_9TELE|nr:hypothetical protein EYF80_054819 [Liparis tanakae]
MASKKSIVSIQSLCSLNNGWANGVSASQWIGPITTPQGKPAKSRGKSRDGWYDVRNVHFNNGWANGASASQWIRPIVTPHKITNTATHDIGRKLFSTTKTTCQATFQGYLYGNDDLAD